tara:strand:- start:8128 stop:8274 length:147 start_codon:yes stop_codon:yes gene_type:complete
MLVNGDNGGLNNATPTGGFIFTSIAGERITFSNQTSTFANKPAVQFCP